MTKRDIFNEVLAGLREVGAFERGGKTLAHTGDGDPCPQSSRSRVIMWRT